MVIKKQISVLPHIGPKSGSLDNLDSVLSTLRRFSDSLGGRKVRQLYRVKKDTKLTKTKILILLIIGLITTVWGVASLIVTPLQMLLSVRLEMIPGLPAYDWWFQPPDEVLLKVYIFNVTNPERFLNGSDKKLRLQEIGPIIYREKLRHTAAIFNPNDTLTYTANRTAVFLPEMNSISLDELVVVPHLSVLLIPAYFHDASMFLKIAINMMLRSYEAKPLAKMTIGQYLWNITDPILVPAQKLAPSLVPTKNLGLLNIIYRDFQNNVTVYIGKVNGDSKFFTINAFDGSEYLPHFSEPRCQLKFRNASEGLSYPQMLSRTTNLTYWRKTVCKQSDIRYKRDDSKYGINAYRFELAPWTYSRTEWEGNKDCFAGNPRLPDGVADVSACYWDFPLAASFPHFLYAEEKAKKYVDGLAADEEKHGSFVLIEPITGTPLEGKARSQINLVVKQLNGFPKNIQRFSDTVLPLAWLEYHQVGVPWKIQFLVYLVAVLMPALQTPFSIVCLIAGGVCCYFLTKNRFLSKNRTKTSGKKRENRSLIDSRFDNTI